MAILKIKKIIEDLENGSTQVLSNLTIATVTNVGIAASVGTAGVVSYAASSGNAGTAFKATSAGNAGTARVAHYGSSGTGGAFSGTAAYS